MKKAVNHQYNRIPIIIGIVLIILLFATFLAIACSVLWSVSDELYTERRQNLNEVSEQIARTVDSICSYSWDVSDAAFTHLLSTEIDKKEDISALLLEAESGTYNREYHLSVVDSHTNYYLSDGHIGLFRNIEFLKKSADERQVVITSITFDSNKEHMLFIHRLDNPLVLKDGTEITHTIMVIPPEVYCSAFFSSGFDGSADIFIVHNDGRNIYRRNNTGAFSTSANIMRILDNVRFLHGESFEELKDSLAIPTGESFEFEYEGSNYFVSMAPIATPDWVVTLIIPTLEINSGAAHLLNVMISRIIAMSVIGVLIATTIILFFVSTVNIRIRAAQQDQLNTALKNAAEEANKANRSKSEFLSHMSHDLRTPLNGILGMLERAEESPDISEELQLCLSNIRSASNHLSALINDVLDMSRLESNGNAPAEKPFDLRTVMDTCCSIISSSAKQHNLIFTYRCNGFQHPYLIGCDLYLRKILLNILGNAVKFTKGNGNVTFEADEISCDGKTATFKFIISDTGIGMCEGYLEHIFEPFWQENNRVRPSSEGTGLGMSIVKKLIDKMGGTIDIYSRINEGSRFTIVLPFSVSLNAFAASDDSEKPLQPSSLKGMTVLICDDNMLNRNIAERLLKKADADVLIACNGEEAVQTFEQSDVDGIDVILMDVMMPVMDGLEATKKIRSLCRPDAESIPIISMTANAFEEDVQKSLAAGMNEHLSKPINGKLLVSTLMKYKKHNLKNTD